MFYVLVANIEVGHSKRNGEISNIKKELACSRGNRDNLGLCHFCYTDTEKVEHAEYVVPSPAFNNVKCWLQCPTS